MSTEGLGSNSLSVISSILKYNNQTFNTSVGSVPLNDTKLNVIASANNWKSARFGTVDAGNTNAVILGVYYNSNTSDPNNLNNNATIVSQHTNTNFRDLFINNYGTNSNNSYGNVIINGKTTIGDYYNSRLYTHSLDIKGTSNILNLRSSNNTLEFICDINSNFNINTSNNKLFINTSINTSNIYATKLNIKYSHLIESSDILAIGAGNIKIEDNSILNIGSNNGTNGNNLNVYGNIYISCNVRIGNTETTNEKIIVSSGITTFKDNSTVNIGLTPTGTNFLNIYGKTTISSNVGIGIANSPDKILSIYGNTLFNNGSVDIGTSTLSDINQLNVYGKCYIANNLGIGTVSNSNYILKINSGTTLFDNNSTVLIGSNTFNNNFQILGNSYLNGKVIIGNSNLTASSYGLFINSNVYVSKGLTVFTTADDSNAINIMGKAFINSNLTINDGSTIYGSGFGLTNIKISSFVNDAGISAANGAKIPASYLSLNGNHFQITGITLNLNEGILGNISSTIENTQTWKKTADNIGYYVTDKKIKIGGEFILNSPLFSVGSNENIIRIADYSNNPITKIGTVDTYNSNTSISLVSATYLSNTIESYNNIPLGSIIYTTTGDYNCQHIFEYNNYNAISNIKATQLVINKTGLIAINSNLNTYIESSDEKLVINGSVNILNDDITPTKLIIGNSNKNNSIINAHGSVFIGSNIIIGNSNIYNGSKFKSSNRIFVASGTTQFANYTNLKIGDNSVVSSNNNLTIYANIGFGIENQTANYNYIIKGNTLFNGSNIYFNNTLTPMLITFNQNTFIGIGTSSDGANNLKIAGNILIDDFSAVTFGTVDNINGNSLNLYSKIGIGTDAVDSVLINIGSGNIITDSNINLTYGGSADAYNYNTINLYSKIGIGTSTINNCLLNIGNINDTININNTSTINIGTFENSNTFLNIYGNTTIKGKTCIGGNILESDDTLIDLHIKKDAKFYGNVYFDGDVGFSNLDLGLLTTINFNNITASGVISGNLTSAGINNYSDFGTININKININTNYFTDVDSYLSLNIEKYDLWNKNTVGDYIYYNKGVYITSGQINNYVLADSLGTPFQIDVNTTINSNLYLGTNNTNGDIKSDTVLYVYGKSAFKNSIICDMPNNSISLFTNANNLNIVQIGSNIDSRPNIEGYHLNVNGNIGLTGNIYTNSDLRLKNNVSTINNALEKIINCRGVNFNYLNESKISIGVIAQEIEKIIPEVVETQGNGFKTVNYLSIIGVLIESIKELNYKIDKLTAI